MTARTRSPWSRRHELAGAVLASTLGLAGCSGDTAGPEEGVTVEDIKEQQRAYAEVAGDPIALAGETVTVSATVNEVLTAEAFTMAGTANTDVGPLLVVGASNPVDLDEGDVVQVTGEVQAQLVLTDIRDMVDVEIDEDPFVDWERAPYLVADSVEILEPAA